MPEFDIFDAEGNEGRELAIHHTLPGLQLATTGTDANAFARTRQA